MTVVDQRPTDASAEPVLFPLAPGAPASTAAASEPAAGPPAAPAPTGAESLLRSVVVVLVALIVMTVVWKVFDQMIGPSWFANRQQHLAADFGTPRAGLHEGHAAGVLQIPGIGANLMVIEGSNTNELRGAPGHRLGTPLPGQRGNSIIEGHRTRWGAPFGDLEHLVKRTRIIAVTRSGLPVEFRVTTVRVVPRSKLAPFLAPSRDHRITLITHAGGGFSDARLVVQGVAGTPSKKPGKGAAPALDPPPASNVKALLAFALCAAIAVAAAIRLRRDHHLAAVAVVVVPLIAGSLLGLLLLIDGTLSPLL